MRARFTLINPTQTSGHINNYHTTHFFIVSGRTPPFSRILSLWQRQALKSHPTNILRVSYTGDNGIDSGTMRLEFFENCIQEMGKANDGAPLESSYHVQNGNFRTFGKIVAAFLAQGKPPPCFLDLCSYRSYFKEIDMMTISSDDLTAKEIKLLEEVRSDCKARLVSFLREDQPLKEIVSN